MGKFVYCKYFVYILYPHLFCPFNLTFISWFEPPMHIAPNTLQGCCSDNSFWCTTNTHQDIYSGILYCCGYCGRHITIRYQFYPYTASPNLLYKLCMSRSVQNYNCQVLNITIHSLCNSPQVFSWGLI